jgi:hypothetical protein
MATCSANVNKLPYLCHALDEDPIHAVNDTAKRYVLCYYVLYLHTHCTHYTRHTLAIHYTQYNYRGGAFARGWWPGAVGRAGAEWRHRRHTHLRVPFWLHRNPGAFQPQLRAAARVHGDLQLNPRRHTSPHPFPRPFPRYFPPRSCPNAFSYPSPPSVPHRLPHCLPYRLP